MNFNGDSAPRLTHTSNPPNDLARSPTLPIELLISILELSLISHSWTSRATQLGLALLVNHTIYTNLVKTAYSTVILNTIESVELFFRTIESSSYLAGLTVNLWIATPRLSGFDTSNYPGRVIENKIRAILSKMRELRQVAVPYEYISRTCFPQVKHLSTSNDLFPPAIPVLNSLESLHINGLPGRNCVNTIISRFIKLRSLKIDVFLSESEPQVPEVSFLCAKMVLLFRQRLKSMTSLKISADASVVEMLKTGLKKTLEEDPRLCLQELRGDQRNILGNLPLQDSWLVEYGQ